jgi:hypothetical protein
MPSTVRPFRSLPTTSLIQRIVDWKGHEVALAQIAMELEFRRGRTVRVLRSVVARELELCAKSLPESAAREALRCQSLDYILREEPEEVLCGVRLLRAAGFSVGAQWQSLTHRIKAMKRAIAWDDGSALSVAAGAPSSVQRYQLLVTVFSRALARASALDIAERGAAFRQWRPLRSVLVRLCQAHVRGERYG